MESVENAELESNVDFRKKRVFSTLTWNVNNRYFLLSIAAMVKEHCIPSTKSCNSDHERNDLNIGLSQT